jgi:hypothetical protein
MTLPKIEKPPQRRAAHPVEPIAGRAMAKRPTDLTDDLAADICRRLADGETLRAICRDDGLPPERTVRTWAFENEAFAPRYARARELGYQTMFEQILEIADNPEADAATVNRDRLKIDARKWMLAKALPKLYGDKLETTTKHQVVDGKEEPLSVRELAREVAFIFSSGMQDLEDAKAPT